MHGAARIIYAAYSGTWLGLPWQQDAVVAGELLQTDGKEEGQRTDCEDFTGSIS